MYLARNSAFGMLCLAIKFQLVVVATSLFWNRCSSFTPHLSEVNIAAAFDVLQEAEDTSLCLTVHVLQIKAAILMAVQEINSKTDGLYDDILPDVFLNLTSYQYSDSSITGLAIQLLEDFEKEQSRRTNDSIVACLGPSNNNLGE